MRIYKASELVLPATIEYSRHQDNRGALVSRVRIIERRGRNLLTDNGNWLWWPTVNHYSDVEVIEDRDTEEGAGDADISKS